MSDEHMRHKLGQRVVKRAFVFIDIDDDMGGAKLPKPFEINIFGTADFGDIAHQVFGMNTESGARNELRTQTQVT